MVTGILTAFTMPRKLRVFSSSVIIAEPPPTRQTCAPGNLLISTDATQTIPGERRILHLSATIQIVAPPAVVGARLTSFSA
jgi:hypothetical protein